MRVAAAGKGKPTMKAPFTYVGSQCHWVQPSMLARHFELHSGDDVLGALCFENAATARGTVNRAGKAAESWTIATAGFWKRGIVLREAGAMDDLAVFRSNFRGEGWVQFIRGDKFHWKSTNVWRTEWGFSNAREELLFLLKPKPKPSNPLKVQSLVEIKTPGRDLDELPLLLMLGWYLNVQSRYSGW
jgi:hypothetical protein